MWMGEINGKTIKVRDFNTSLRSMDGSSRQENSMNKKTGLKWYIRPMAY